MPAPLIDSLIPPTPGLADGFRFEPLNESATSFRSSNRLHLWSGAIYQAIGLALGNRLPSEQILSIAAPEHGAPEAVLALHRLAKTSIVRDSPGNEGTWNEAASPEIFGDSAAPYRTAIAFERRQDIPAATHAPGYYVYGRGFDETTARIGCLAEAAERKSIYATGRRQLAHIPTVKLGQAAVSPRSLLDPREPGFEEQPVDWTVAYSMVSGCIRYVPAAFCFAGWSRGTRIEANSTGCAAGPNATSAALSGFFELVERDALRSWWLAGRPACPVRTQDFGSSFIDDMHRYLRERGRRLVVLDITAIPGVPAFAAFSFRNDGCGGVVGASSHFDALTAITSATLEMGLALNWSTMIRYGSQSLVPEIGAQLQGPVEWTRPRNADNYLSMSYPDSAAGLARAKDLMRNQGNDLLVVDLTSPRAKFSIVRVIVPGLRRFNPGTMYRLVESRFRSP